MPLALVGTALIGGVTSVISGNKAAGAVQNAADQSAGVQKYIYDTTRSDYAPYRNVGTNALYKLAGLAGVGTADPNAPTATAGRTITLPGGQTYTIPGAASTTGTQNGKPDFSGFYTSPDYQFRLKEGLKAIEGSAAARGARFSGATQKALSDYAGNSASQEYGQFWNRLAGLAGVGQAATGSVAQAGQNFASGTSDAYTQAGNARASAYANTGNAINGTVQNLAGAYLYTKGYGGGGGGYGGFGGYGGNI